MKILWVKTLYLFWECLRTGTTLLESIIASNKNVFSGGEMVLMTNLIGDYVFKNDAPNIEGLKILGNNT